MKSTPLIAAAVAVLSGATNAAVLPKAPAGAHSPPVTEANLAALVAGEEDHIVSLERRGHKKHSGRPDYLQDRIVNFKEVFRHAVPNVIVNYNSANGDVVEPTIERSYDKNAIMISFSGSDKTKLFPGFKLPPVDSVFWDKAHEDMMEKKKDEKEEKKKRKKGGKKGKKHGGKNGGAMEEHRAALDA